MEANTCKLDNIKSPFILKLLLNQLYKSHLLELIRYSGSLKDKTGLNIEDYKKLSNRIIIKEENGNLKEFKLNTNILLLEAKYSVQNFFRCKEYYENGMIKYEGWLYKRQKFKGKGYDIRGNEFIEIRSYDEIKEYYLNGKLQFEGEYYKGRRWNGKGYNYEGKEEFEIKYGQGKGKEFYINGELLFEGEYFNGKRNGKGKEYYLTFETNPSTYEIREKKQKLKFEGEYLDGNRNGKGKEYSVNGNIIYEGEYSDNVRNGKGKEHGIFGVFEGEYLNGKKWTGRFYNPDNKDNQLINGKGKITEYFDYYTKLILFEGEYLNGEKNGYGIEYYYKKIEDNRSPFYRQQLLFKEEHEKKKKFEGTYLNGKRNNGFIYDFESTRQFPIKNGSGYIKEYNLFGKILSEGYYLNGEKNGYGKEYFYPKYCGASYGGTNFNNFQNINCCLKFEGQYLNGKRHGKGKLFSTSSRMDYQNQIQFPNNNFPFNYNNNFNGFNNNNFGFFGQGFGNIPPNFPPPQFYQPAVRLVTKFEGEYLNGEINGKGIRYDSNGKILIEGEYVNGKLISGKEYKNGQVIYEGRFSNVEIYGEKNQRKFYDYDIDDINLFEEGELKEIIIPRRNGEGREFFFKKEGMESNNKCIKFEGIYLNGKKWSGKGYNYDGKEEFELVNGKGKIKEHDYNGELIFEGEYLNGEIFNGKGKELNNKGEIIFEGEFLNGKCWNGKGKVYENDVLIFEGEVLNGKYQEKEKKSN